MENSHREDNADTREAIINNLMELHEQLNNLHETEGGIEQKLKDSEEKFMTLVENIPVGIYYSDLLGKFLYGNKMAEEISGYEREELIGKNYFELKLLDPKGLAKAAKLLSMNMFGKKTGPDEFTIRRKDGTLKVVEIATQLIKINGQRVVLGMVQDITERIQRDKEQKILMKNLEIVLERLVDISGFVPICSFCKKIRDAQGKWHQLEDFMTENYNILFSHSLCPDCQDEQYPKSNNKT